MKLFRWEFGLCLIGMLGFKQTGCAQTLYRINPGQEAIISFHFSSPPIINGVVPDVFYVGSSGGGAINNLTSTTYSLYDGDTLLGTTTRNGTFSISGQAFRSLDNPMPGYVSGPSVPIDFTSILNGTINGTIVFQPTFTNPSPGDNTMSGFQLSTVHQINFNSGNAPRAPIIDSIRVVAVPEPSSLALILVASGCLIGRAISRTTRR